MPEYERYVKDEKFLAGYNEYQSKYANEMRESDRVILGLIADHGRGASLLDIGCSTGNLLRHIKRAFPSLALTGGDLAESSLTIARADTELTGVEFKRIDMLDIEGKFDIITGHAVTYLLEWPEFERAIASIAKALSPGGVFISFEWMHPFEDQDLAITEVTPSHPDGLTIYSRPYMKVSRVLDKSGLTDVDFHPFSIPLDLPLPGYRGDPISYTIKDETGNRMCMRGALFQPWCHMTAIKRG